MTRCCPPKHSKNCLLKVWLVAANTVDDCPDHIVMLVANDPLAMAALRAGYPVAVVEDAMNAEATGNA